MLWNSGRLDRRARDRRPGVAQERILESECVAKDGRKMRRLEIVEVEMPKLEYDVPKPVSLRTVSSELEIGPRMKYEAPRKLFMSESGSAGARKRRKKGKKPVMEMTMLDDFEFVDEEEPESLTTPRREWALVAESPREGVVDVRPRREAVEEEKKSPVFVIECLDATEICEPENRMRETEAQCDIRGEPARKAEEVEARGKWREIRAQMERSARLRICQEETFSIASELRRAMKKGGEKKDVVRRRGAAKRNEGSEDERGKVGQRGKKREDGGAERDVVKEEKMTQTKQSASPRIEAAKARRNSPTKDAVVPSHKGKRSESPKQHKRRHREEAEEVEESRERSVSRGREPKKREEESPRNAKENRERTAKRHRKDGGADKDKVQVEAQKGKVGRRKERHESSSASFPRSDSESENECETKKENSGSEHEKSEHQPSLVNKQHESGERVSSASDDSAREHESEQRKSSESATEVEAKSDMDSEAVVIQRQSPQSDSQSEPNDRGGNESADSLQIDSAASSDHSEQKPQEEQARENSQQSDAKQEESLQSARSYNDEMTSSNSRSSQDSLAALEPSDSSEEEQDVQHEHVSEKQGHGEEEDAEHSAIAKHVSDEEKCAQPENVETKQQTSGDNGQISGDEEVQRERSSTKQQASDEDKDGQRDHSSATQQATDASPVVGRNVPDGDDQAGHASDHANDKGATEGEQDMQQSSKDDHASAAGDERPSGIAAEEEVPECQSPVPAAENQVVVDQPETASVPDRHDENEETAEKSGVPSADIQKEHASQEQDEHVNESEQASTSRANEASQHSEATKESLSPQGSDKGHSVKHDCETDTKPPPSAEKEPEHESDEEKVADRDAGDGTQSDLRNTGNAHEGQNTAEDSLSANSEYEKESCVGNASQEEGTVQIATAEPVQEMEKASDSLQVQDDEDGKSESQHGEAQAGASGAQDAAHHASEHEDEKCSQKDSQSEAQAKDSSVSKSALENATDQEEAGNKSELTQNTGDDQSVTDGVKESETKKRRRRHRRKRELGDELGETTESSRTVELVHSGTQSEPATEKHKKRKRKHRSHNATESSNLELSQETAGLTGHGQEEPVVDEKAPETEDSKELATAEPENQHAQSTSHEPQPQEESMNGLSKSQEHEKGVKTNTESEVVLDGKGESAQVNNEESRSEPVQSHQEEAATNKSESHSAQVSAYDSLQTKENDSEGDTADLKHSETDAEAQTNHEQDENDRDDTTTERQVATDQKRDENTSDVKKLVQHEQAENDRENTTTESQVADQARVDNTSEGNEHEYATNEPKGELDQAEDDKTNEDKPLVHNEKDEESHVSTEEVRHSAESQHDRDSKAESQNGAPIKEGAHDGDQKGEGGEQDSDNTQHRHSDEIPVTTETAKEHASDNSGARSVAIVPPGEQPTVTRREMSNPDSKNSDRPESHNDDELPHDTASGSNSTQEEPNIDSKEPDDTREHSTKQSEKIEYTKEDSLSVCSSYPDSTASDDSFEHIQSRPLLEDTKKDTNASSGFLNGSSKTFASEKVEPPKPKSKHQSSKSSDSEIAPSSSSEPKTSAPKTDQALQDLMLRRQPTPKGTDLHNTANKVESAQVSGQSSARTNAADDTKPVYTYWTKESAKTPDMKGLIPVSEDAVLPLDSDFELPEVSEKERRQGRPPITRVTIRSNRVTRVEGHHHHHKERVGAKTTKLETRPRNPPLSRFSSVRSPNDTLSQMDQVLSRFLSSAGQVDEEMARDLRPGSVSHRNHIRTTSAVPKLPHSPANSRTPKSTTATRQIRVTSDRPRKHEVRWL